jgi:hypothetical protein
MLSRLLPQRIDNNYGGYKLALWLFGLLVLMKAAVGLNCILNGAYVASHADGIPLATFTPGGAQTVVSLFALWGVSQLIICLLCVLLLVRYRAMVPCMFALLILESLSRRVILLVMPPFKTGASGGSYVQLVVLALMVVGLALSLRSRGAPQAQG